jgi:DEAD/DEAH box helicase domain-containing protein
MCKHANEVMSKAGGEVILRSLLNMEIDVDSLPMGPEDSSPAGIETVILAQPVLPRGRMVDVVEVKREEDGGERVDKIVGTLDDEGVEREVRIKEEPQD